MTRYILDTHVLSWFLEHDARLPENIREDIEYMQHEYYVSALTLLEMDNLQKLKKIKLQYSFEKIIEQLKNACIGVIFDISVQDLGILYDLEMKVLNGKAHGDYMDRAIIATAIAKHYTCISADEKFRHYRENGLQLLEV